MWVYGGYSYLWIIFCCDGVSFTQNFLIYLHKFIQNNSLVDTIALSVNTIKLWVDAITLSVDTIELWVNEKNQIAI